MVRLVLCIFREKENEKLGLMPPDLADFTYKGQFPSQRNGRTYVS